MSASTAFPLRYVLPTTTLTVQATLRLAVVVDDQGGHLEPEVAVTLAAPWHPNPLRAVRRVESGDRILVAGDRAVSVTPGSLRASFDRAHPRTAALIADLSARSEQYLAGLRMGEEPSQVVSFGQALEIIHRELAAADRTRREWISRQGRDLGTAEWDLTGTDMVTIAGQRASLTADIDIPEGRARELAREFGLLLALVADEARGSGRSHTQSAGIAVYRRSPERWADGAAAGAWVRDDALSRLWLADSGDQPVDVPFPRVSSETERLIAPLLGRPLASDPHLEAATRAARTQLDLLDASDEYSRIASTQYRADEIAALQHTMRLAYLPRQRSGD